MRKHCIKTLSNIDIVVVTGGTNNLIDISGTQLTFSNPQPIFSNPQPISSTSKNQISMNPTTYSTIPPCELGPIGNFTLPLQP